eukprot:gb/GECH01014280.1/.p1 GENE.gb/GECH01014280.1/~~gb/GECH01014280.1/.p1  ORF type:complete len:156 (+),score=28.51 gb/GECH01014280.1/:1-468(+)
MTLNLSFFPKELIQHVCCFLTAFEANKTLFPLNHHWSNAISFGGAAEQIWERWFYKDFPWVTSSGRGRHSTWRSAYIARLKREIEEERIAHRWRMLMREVTQDIYSTQPNKNGNITNTSMVMNSRKRNNNKRTGPRIIRWVKEKLPNSNRIFCAA